MKYWIGVIGTKISRERFGGDEEAWFCMPKSAEVGDLMVMYASKKAVGKKHGLFAVYEVVGKDSSKDRVCSSYGIFSGTGERPVYTLLKCVKAFSKPISYTDMMSHPLLQNASFVRRNFQATYFPISEREFNAITRLSLVSPT